MQEIQLATSTKQPETSTKPDNPDIKQLVFEKIKQDLSPSSSSTNQPETSTKQNVRICIVSSDEDLLRHRPQENTRLHYTPKIVSIGPLHHGKPELQPMEVLKNMYLEDLLLKAKKKDLRKGKKKESSEGKKKGSSSDVEESKDYYGLLHKFINNAIENMDRVREFYRVEETNLLSTDNTVDFVKMLVKDGCFLLEFLSSWTRTYGQNFEKHILLMSNLINRDILLFENQIPFFVLQEFNRIREGTDQNMTKLAYDHFYETAKWEESIMTFLGPYRNKSILIYEPSSLLDLYHVMHKFSENNSWAPINSGLIEDQICRTLRKWPMMFFSLLFLIVSYPMYIIHTICFVNITYPRTLTSATEIEEAGVILEGCRVDLWFDKGTLLIPVLTLNQESLCLMQNLLYFESHNQNKVTPYVHKYVSFLSLLIKNPEDLKVMEKHNIIVTGGGADESFALVNKLIEAGFKGLMARADHRKIKRGLKKYCKKPRHRWRAKLMKDYFGNPWSIIGVLVGVILLVLTLIQTVFTVKSYYHQ